MNENTETGDNQFDSFEGKESSLPEEAKSAAEKLARKSPEKLVEMMAMEMSSVGNPLYHRMTTEHISQVLDLASKHDERQYNLHRRSQENDFAERKSGRAY